MSLRTIDDLPDIPIDVESGVDVHDYLRALREQTPFAKQFGVIVALRHRHIAQFVNDEVSRQLETELKLMQGIDQGPIYDFIANILLFANGAVHARRRMPLQRTFAFKLMDAMRPKVIALAQEMIAERVGAGPIDFLNEVAGQIPARIIADILGIPRDDLPVFMEWIQDTANSLGFIDLDQREQIESSMRAFDSYVADLLAERRAKPREDFLSDYVAATSAAGEMSDLEIRAQVIGLILAGSDTTRGSMCMTLAFMLTHPEQWRDFCRDPEGLKVGVVNEGLRYGPIVSGLPRVMLRDVEADGCLIPQGAVLAVSLVSALRDPEIYADPERFNIHRQDHPRWHPIFGAGAHRCLGEALARAEMEETLALVARLAPGTELAGPFPTQRGDGIRQVDQLRVAFAA